MIQHGDDDDDDSEHFHVHVDALTISTALAQYYSHYFADNIVSSMLVKL